MVLNVFRVETAQRTANKELTCVPMLKREKTSCVQVALDVGFALQCALAVFSNWKMDQKKVVLMEIL